MSDVPGQSLVIVAGPNGAGKSTLIRANPLSCDIFNPDELARNMAGGPVRKMLRAGRMMHDLVEAAMASRSSFGLETTLSGHGTQALMVRAKAIGYRVWLLYVGVDSLDLAKLRIMNRMALGGHGVPERDVERRYPRSLDNLQRALEVADIAQIFDNSRESGHRLIAEKRDGRLVVLDDTVVWFKRFMPNAH